MVLDVGVRVSGLDFDSPDVSSVLAEKHPHVLVSGVQPCILTFSADDERPVGHAVQIVRALQSDFPDLVVDGVDRDLVGISDIAQRAGVSREGARKWTQAAGFPTAFGYLASPSMPIWAWTDVVDWLLSERSLELDECLPSVKVLTQIENCLMQNPDSTTVEWHQIGGAPTKRIAPPISADTTSVRVFKAAYSRTVSPSKAGVRAQEFTASRGALVGANARQEQIGCVTR